MRKDGSKRAEPGLEPESGAILHRQTHPRINAYHDILIMLLKSNIDISFIGSGPAAKALIYYITDYITKSGLPTHVAFSALQVVIQKVRAATQEAENSENPEAVLDAGKQGRTLLTKACNALIGQQELSGQQVAMHLLGLADGEGDHYKSHDFRTLHWAAFRGWLRNELRTLDPPATPVVDPLIGTAAQLVLPDEADADASRVETPETILHHDVDEDEVLLDLSKEGSLSLAHSQLKDYRFRGDALADISLYWFVALTERITLKSEVKRLQSKKNSGRGVKPMPRIQFREEHPYAETHLLRLRRTPIVPVIVGPTLVSKSSDYERYCCDILMLFKPWRTLDDLRKPGESWSHAFESVVFDEASLIKIANMNHLHECKDAKDTYNELRRKGIQKHNLIDDRMLSAHLAVRDSFENPSMEEDSDVLNVIREFAPHLLEPSRKLNNEKLTRDELRALAAEEAIGAASRVGLNEVDEEADVDMQIDDAAAFGSTHGVDLDAMKQMMSTYRENLDAETGNSSETDSDADDDQAVDSCLATIDEMEIDPQSRLIHDDNPAFSKDAETLVDGVVKEFSLNSQQERAMKVIAYHKISGVDAQLMMIVAGPRGTGKSRVIAAVTALFQKLNVSNSLRKAAPTGIAAYAISGTTIHSLLGLVGRGNFFSRKSLEKAQNRLAGVTDIFVDEFSMVGANFFSLMSTRLGQVRGNDKPFGGFNMTFFGDPRQLPPVGDSPLWRPVPLPQGTSSVQDSAAALAGSARGQRTTHGQGLWSQIEEVVLLTENHRAALDKSYADMVERIARGRGTEVDRQAFLSRDIMTAEFDRREWIDAPLVTADKVMRDRWNLEAAKSHATRFKRELHSYIASDLMGGEAVTGALKDALLDYPSSTKTRDRLGKLPLVVGMRVMILHNILTSVGVVNGAEGTIERILYDETLSGERVASVVFVKVEGAVVNIPGLEPGVVPVFPDTVTMNLPLKSQRSLTVNRTQLPLLPAYSFTDYKSQARTLKHVVLDVASAASLESAYVMVSRAVGMNNVLLLRPFPLSKINRQQSPGVFVEMSRLKTLDGTCQARFARKGANRKARSFTLRP